MPYPFDHPGIYSIHVTGMLATSWSEYLGGMTIVETGAFTEDSQVVTILTGELPDQAALFGVLNTLYDRGYYLLHVHYLGRTSEENAQKTEHLPT